MYAADGILGSASVRLTLGTGVCSAEHQQLRTECAACSVRTGYVFFGTLVYLAFGVTVVAYTTLISQLQHQAEDILVVVLLLVAFSGILFFFFIFKRFIGFLHKS